MARRSDAELREEHKQAQARLTERMARRADRRILILRRAASEISEVAKTLDKESHEPLLTAALAASLAADALVGQWEEANNQTPDLPGFA